MVTFYLQFESKIHSCEHFPGGDIFFHNSFLADSMILISLIFGATVVFATDGKFSLFIFWNEDFLIPQIICKL